MNAIIADSSPLILLSNDRQICQRHSKRDRQTKADLLQLSIIIVFSSFSFPKAAQNNLSLISWLVNYQLSGRSFDPRHHRSCTERERDTCCSSTFLPDFSKLVVNQIKSYSLTFGPPQLLH